METPLGYDKAPQLYNVVKLYFITFPQHSGESPYLQERWDMQIYYVMPQIAELPFLLRWSMSA